jgi:hypothetical protein
LGGWVWEEKHRVKNGGDTCFLTFGIIRLPRKAQLFKEEEMITLTAKIEIEGKTPEQIYKWLIDLDNEKYRKWHPDHREWRIIRQTPDIIGSVVYFDERFNHFRLKLTGKLIELKPDEYLLFKLKSPVPAHLSLTIKATRKGTSVTHEVRAGYDGGFGKITDWFLRKLYLPKEFEEALAKHAREEFKNLERLL